MKAPTARRQLLAIVILLVVGIGAFFAWRQGRGDRNGITASGTVEATEAELGFPLAGRLESVSVQEGDTVRTGQELARLDRAETLARRAQAEAQIAAARALLLELKRGTRSEEIAQARASMNAAQDRYIAATTDFGRAQALHSKGLISQEAFDKAAVAQDVTKNQAAEAREAYRLALAGPRRERVSAQQAALAQAEAAREQIDATLANMTVRAPFDGFVTAKNREPGEIVPAGSPVVTIRDRSDRWVRIYVPESKIGAVRVGSTAAITTDSAPGRRFEGQVATIATEAEFTPRSVQTREERVRLVYAVKVRIVNDPGFVLKPGMPADVRLASVPK